MSQLLATLGFAVNERMRRCACLLHGGSNRSAFSWREDGHWCCFSCGRRGDRIALVRAVRNCSFRDAVEYLAALSGVEFRQSRLSREEITRVSARRERAEVLAWAIRDAIVLLESRSAHALGLVERLQRAIGERLKSEIAADATERLWDVLSRIAPLAAYFLAAFDFLGRANAEARIRFALASGVERRATVLGERNAE